jgi:hypothetical protein
LKCRIGEKRVPVSELEKITETTMNKYNCRMEWQVDHLYYDTNRKFGQQQKKQKKESSCWNAFSEISNRSYTLRSKEE